MGEDEKDMEKELHQNKRIRRRPDVGN